MLRCLCVPYQSTMAQQMSRLRHLVLLLLLLWLVECRHTKSPAALLDAQIAGVDVIKVNGNANVDSGVSFGSGGDAATETSAAHDCFERYLQDSHEAGNTYATAYRKCQDLGNVSHTKAVVRQQSVRKDVTLAMDDMCRASDECSHIESDLEFFRCNSRNSYANTNTILQVYLNSTSAILELENKYQEAEKKILQCIIAVQRKYVNSTSSAYMKLSRCLYSSSGQ